MTTRLPLTTATLYAIADIACTQRVEQIRARFRLDLLTRGRPSPAIALELAEALAAQEQVAQARGELERDRRAIVTVGWA